MSALGLMTNPNATQMLGLGGGAAGNMMMGTSYHALDDNSTQGITNPLMGGQMATELIKV